MKISRNPYQLKAVWRVRHVRTAQKETKVMATQIFVPLSKRGQIDDVIPYLEALARPGMEVVFLTRYRTPISWMEVELTAIHTGLKTTAMMSSALRNGSNRSLRIHEEKIQHARDLLKKRGWITSHHYYAGRLRDAIVSLQNPEDEMIVLMEERPSGLKSLFRQLEKLIGRLHSADNNPIVFLRAGRQY
jgi:hypothetical protein